MFGCTLVHLKICADTRWDLWNLKTRILNVRDDFDGHRRILREVRGFRFFPWDAIKLRNSVLCVYCKVSSYNWMALQVYKVSKLTDFPWTYLLKVIMVVPSVQIERKDVILILLSINVNIRKIQIKLNFIGLVEMHLIKEIVCTWDVESIKKFYVTSFVYRKGEKYKYQFAEFKEQFNSLKKSHILFPSYNGVRFCFLTRYFVSFATN